MGAISPLHLWCQTVMMAFASLSKCLTGCNAIVFARMDCVPDLEEPEKAFSIACLRSQVIFL
jgi:hypothetical protein